MVQPVVPSEAALRAGDSHRVDERRETCCVSRGSQRAPDMRQYPCALPCASVGSSDIDAARAIESNTAAAGAYLPISNNVCASARAT